MTRDPRLEDLFGPLAVLILRDVARRGHATVGDLVEYIRATERRSVAYTTVMTVMGRLHERGVLNRERRGRQYVYSVAGSEAEVIDRLSGLVVDRVVRQYGSAALRHFALRLADLPPATRRDLESLADEPE